MMPCNSPDVLAALTEKRAELGARRTSIAAQLTAIEQKLTALDETISMFAGQIETAGEPIVPQNTTSIGSLHRGEVGWSSLEVLRRSETPMTARQIAQEICRQRKLLIPDHEMRRLGVLVVKALRHRQTLDLVRDVGRTSNNAILWMSEHEWT